MIQVIPAISYIGNQVARAPKGNYKSATIYADKNPLEMAAELEKAGIKWIHLLDLEGARSGHFSNYEMLRMITHHTNLFVDIGGGINTEGEVRVAFEHGAKMITAASVAVHNRKEFSSWLITHGCDKIMLSVDAVGGKITTRGRTEQGDLDIMDLLEYYYYHNLKYVKCTDVDVDGQSEGPSFDFYKRILKKYPDLRVIASGGIRHADDIRQLEDIGCYGVIFAKSFYEGTITTDDLQPFL